MKRNEIVSQLEQIATIKKHSEMLAAVNALKSTLESAPTDTEGRITHYVHVNARVLDPTHTYPTQMVACHDVLLGIGRAKCTLAEVKSAIGANADALKTRQDPYRIYAFYQKRMEEEGWLKREAVRA